LAFKQHISWMNYNHIKDRRSDKAELQRSW